MDILFSETGFRALATAMMVGVTCGLIGTFIVLRNMSLIGDALSHAILPGIYFAFIFVGYSTIGFFVGSVIAGLVSAAAITWLQTKIKTKNDAAIGIVFTAMFSIGVMGISSLNSKQGTHLDLKDFLFGNVLGTSYEDLFLTAIILVYTIACIIIFYRYFFITTFQPTIAATMGIDPKTVHYFIMLMLSFAVVSALRSVGVILVVAMLITPASTALLLSERLNKVLLLSGVFGAMAALLGFTLSIALDTTPGPAMVICATLFYIISALLAPQKGLVIQYFAKTREKSRILKEDILKTIASKKLILNVKNIANELGASLTETTYQINQLVVGGMIKDPNSLELTLAGEIKVENLVRAHRLWESYQVNSMGLDKSHIHDDAERLEHHLSEEILDELDARLGFPANDPHGSPIPKRIEGLRLSKGEVNKKYTVTRDQRSDKVESFLWEIGIAPNQNVELIRKDKNDIVISAEGKNIKIPTQVAKNIQVEENIETN